MAGDAVPRGVDVSVEPADCVAVAGDVHDAVLDGQTDP